MTSHWDLRQPLRARADTGPPPDNDNALHLLADHWGGRAEVVDDSFHPRHRRIRIDGVDALFRADPGWEGPHDGAHSVRLLHHLSINGAPVPRVLPQANGEISLPWQDYTISLEQALDGAEPDQERLDLLPAAGQALARVHEAARDFEQPQVDRPVGEYVQSLLQLAAEREDLGPRAPFVQLRELIEDQFADRFDLHVPWVMCHGDVGCGNVIVDADDRVRFIDFGRAAHMPALVDALAPRFQWLMGKPKSGRGLLSPDEAASFVAGYAMLRPLSDSERAALPLLWAAFYAEYLSFIWIKWGERRDQPPFTRFGINERIQTLPTDALSMGEDLLQALHVDG